MLYNSIRISKIIIHSIGLLVQGKYQPSMKNKLCQPSECILLVGLRPGYHALQKSIIKSTIHIFLSKNALLRSETLYYPCEFGLSAFHNLLTSVTPSCYSLLWKLRGVWKTLFWYAYNFNYAFY